MDISEYRNFVLSIYRAVSEPEHWPEILSRLAETVDARGCVIYEINPVGSGQRVEATIVSDTFNVNRVKSYLSEFQQYEERDHMVFDRSLLATDDVAILPESILYTGERRLYRDLDEYLSRPHVKMLIESGIRYRTGALLDKDNPHRARFSLSMSESRGPFNAEDQRLLADILPHLAKSLELSRPTFQAQESSNALYEVMQHLNIGICVVDAKGRVVLLNPEFERQIDVFGKFEINRHRMLEFNDSRQGVEFRDMLNFLDHHGRCGARPRKESLVVESVDPPGVLCVEIVPLDQSNEFGTRPFNGSVVFCRDTSVPIRIDSELARMTFDRVTDAEWRVVEKVCDGLTNSQIARQREVSVETINAQMKSILDKTNAVNRTQLVRLLCNFSKPDCYQIAQH